MITGIMHFYNEELLIGEWIDHHLAMFDRAILINHKSTDNSVEIARAKLPKDWRIVDSKLENFDALLNDAEVVEYEKDIREGWKISLNTTEFLFQPDIDLILREWERDHPDTLAFGSRAACLVDQEEKPIESPIWKNRHHGFLYAAGMPSFHRWRWIHRAEHGHYTPGRHDTHLPKVHLTDFLHLHFFFSPWPQCLPRKLQIQNRMPDSDKAKGFGVQHITSEIRLRQIYATLPKENLLLDHAFNNAYKYFSDCDYYRRNAEALNNW